MKKLHTTLLLLTALALAGPTLANGAHAGHHPATDQAAAADLTDGEIRKIDKETKKITIKHGEIKSLDMPPMTMVFQVKDPAMLDKVKTGDKIKFRVVQEDGKMVVTAIQAAQ